MKRTLRFNCFETNSSSMHTVTMVGKSDINNDYKYDEEIEITLDEYGWNGHPCDDFLSKLAYAMSMILHTEYPGFECWGDYGFTVDQDVLENLDGYNIILNAINNHFRCEKIVIEKNGAYYYPYGYIDHQSCEDYSSLQDFLNDWDVDAERFLFDDSVIVLIDNDNH